MDPGPPAPKAKPVSRAHHIFNIAAKVAAVAGGGAIGVAGCVFSLGLGCGASIGAGVGLATGALSCKDSDSTASCLSKMGRSTVEGAVIGEAAEFGGPFGAGVAAGAIDAANQYMDTGHVDVHHSLKVGVETAALTKLAPLAGKAVAPLLSKVGNKLASAAGDGAASCSAHERC